MDRQATGFCLTYFPYTFMDEEDLKRLLPYFDCIRLLQVMPGLDAGLPAAASKSIRPFFPVTSSTVLQLIERAHRSYRQLASAQRDGPLLESLRILALQEDLENSRTRLTSYFRGRRPELSAEERALVDDAVFLLLTQEFDQKQLEVERALERIRGLEGRLEQAVGLSADEEQELKLEEAPLPPGASEVRSLYALARLRAWTRLFCNLENPEPLLPLTTSLEVVEEICERFPPRLVSLTPKPPSLPLAQCHLAVLPDPAALPLAEVLQWRERLHRQGAAEEWGRALAAVLNHLYRKPAAVEEDGELRPRLAAAAELHRQLWPAPEGPAQFLRLLAITFAGLEPQAALALAAGPALPPLAPYRPEGPNGVMFLLAPAAPPPDGG